MSEESVTLYELLNLSIGTPQRGAVNFSALHALLHAVLTQLDIRETKTRWRDTPPGDGRPDAPVGVTAAGQEQEPEPGDVSPSPAPSSTFPCTSMYQKFLGKKQLLDAARKGQKYCR